MLLFSWKNKRYFFRYFSLSGTLLLLSSLLFSGCSNSSLIVPYTSKLSSVREDISQGKVSPAVKTLTDPASKSGQQQNLYLCELARSEQFSNQYSSSIQNFSLVEQIMYNQNMAAQVQLSQITNSTLSLFTNDNIQNYQLPGYEQILVYNFQALNYLFSLDLTNALVEARKADEQQSYEALINQKQEQAYEQAKEKNNINVAATDYSTRFKNMIDAASDVKNSYQNPYTFFVSGMLYELQNDYTDALIDYKEALKIQPTNPYLQQKVMAMQYQLGKSSALQASETAFNTTYTPPVSGSGQLIVLYEQNFVPLKTSINLPVIVNNVVHNISLPCYQGPFQPISALTLTNLSTHASIGETAPIVNIQALAAKSLDEQMPMIIFRSILRFVTQQTVNQEVNQQSPLLGALLNITDVITSGADLRSWTTLPNNAQILTTSLSANSYTLQLSSIYGATSTTASITAGKTTILWIKQIGTQFFIQSVTI